MTENTLLLLVIGVREAFLQRDCERNKKCVEVEDRKTKIEFEERAPAGHHLATGGQSGSVASGPRGDFYGAIRQQSDFQALTRTESPPSPLPVKEGGI